MSEAQEQAAVITYCELRGIPVYHIPNEGKRSVYAGANLKRQGLRAGVPDLCIPVARGRYHSLYIEMKADGGKVTPKQAEWIALLRGQGMCAAVCVGADNAKALIDRYMALG
ncbi:MAG: VRR-NUC domain-containing protein [Eggerthellaceae bacterium]|nr:VRR-NUC domain-containing protein [Eggerthellaceae bacterium]